MATYLPSHKPVKKEESEEKGKVLFFWFGLVLLYINHYRLFPTKSSLYIYIYIYIYIKDMICKHIFFITFLYEPKLIFFAHS